MSEEGTPDPELSELLSAQEAADFLGITRSRLHRLRQENRIPATRTGWFSWQFRREDLMRYAEQAAAQGASLLPEGTPLPLPRTASHALDSSAPADFRQVVDELVDNSAPFPSTTQSNMNTVFPPPLVRLVNALLASAIDSDASELHIEPTHQSVICRMRVDGLLREWTTLPQYLHFPVVTRLKVMAELNPFSHQPQIGSFQVNYRKDQRFTIRASCLITPVGEKVVLRLFNESQVLTGLWKLGMLHDEHTALIEGCQKPGLLLLAGKPGAGTTTTAYNLLMLNNTLQRSILTFEEYPTYPLPGITQVYANPHRGLTWTTVGSSLLAQNPDILFLGDIDTREAATLAVEAAERGICVWATLHVPDAVGALLRLRSFGIAPERLMGAVHMVMAQGLVRRNCLNCRTERSAEKREIRYFLNPMHDTLSDSFFLAQSSGCEKCGQTGYRGQWGIFEALVLNEEFRYLFLEGASSGKLLDAAQRGGMREMRYDLGHKIHAGVISLEEGYRSLHPCGR